MSSTLTTTGHTLPVHTERPERSRNAKAQARHRAKRKAYIEQLEQTVTKLQTALGPSFSPDQITALPPPLIKIRELEQENARLHREIEDLRRLLTDSGTKNYFPDYSRRNSLSTFHDSRECDREFKKRKMPGDDLYMSPGSTPPNDILTRPPPLTIPQPLSHHYVSSHGSSHHNGSTPSSLFNLHAPAFQMPNTPSGSSSTSSPPFSASTISSYHDIFVFYPVHQQPAAMHPTSQSPVHQRQPLSNHTLPQYTQHPSQYDSVKVEDDNYGQSNGHQNGHYTASLPSFGHSHQNELDSWHTYSAERAQLHR